MRLRPSLRALFLASALLSLIACDAPADTDAGPDAAAAPDSGPIDAGSIDAGTPVGEGGPSDAGAEDAGAEDASPPDASPPDAGPRAPVVLSRAPVADATDAAIDGEVTVTFDLEMDASTIDADSFYVENAIGIRVPGVVSGSGTSFVFTPEGGLVRGTLYTVTVTTAAASSAGLTLASEEVWTFATAAPVWGPSELVEQVDDVRATARPALLALDDGALALWRQGDGSPNNIWANRYIEGSGWGAAAAIETSAHSATLVAAARNAAGQAIAVWTQPLTAGGRRVVMASRFDAGAWGAAEPVHEANANDAREPSVVLDETGAATVAFTRQGGAAVQVYASRQPMGGAWSALELIEASGASGSSLSLAIDGAGVVTAFFRLGREAWTNRFEPGAGWGGAELVRTGPNDLVDVRGAVNAAGDAVIVWAEQPNSAADVFSLMAAVRPSGGAFGAPTLLETDDYDHVNNPLVQMDPAGNAIVVWDQAAVGDLYSIRSNRFVVGSGWQGDVIVRTVADVDDEIVDAVLGIDPAGNATVLWRYADSTGAEATESARYQAGVGWGLVVVLPDAPTAAYGAAQIAVGRFGEAYAGVPNVGGVGIADMRANVSR